MIRDDSFPARGVVIGCLLGLAMWAALGLLVWFTVAHADAPTPPVTFCAATPGNACHQTPTPTIVPQVPGIDAATIIPATVQPVRLANTGADGRHVLIGLLVAACGAWLVCVRQGWRR